MISKSLPPDLDKFVRDEVASGRFQSADDVVREGLRLLRERMQRADALRRDLDEGLEQLERGEGIEISDERAEERFFEEIKTRGAERLKRERGEA